MIRAAFVLALAACLALAASPAAAQDALSKRVSLDLKAMAPADAFKVLADSVGLKVTVDAAVTTPIDILVKDVSARTALTTMCESIGCRWTAASGVIAVSPAKDPAPTPSDGPAKVAVMTRQTGGTVEQKKQLLDKIQAALKQPLPAGMRFENAPLGAVCARLSEALGLSITMASEHPGLATVTADFSGQTLMTALKHLGEAGNAAPVLRLTISDRRAPGDPVTPSIMISFKVDAKKK
jgi:hypothetical protein